MTTKYERKMWQRVESRMIKVLIMLVIGFATLGMLPIFGYVVICLGTIATIATGIEVTTDLNFIDYVYSVDD